MAKTELHQRVTDRLKELGIGAIEATQRVPGLERNYIRDFLQGKKKSFSNSKMPMVAQALGLSVTDLVGAPPRPFTNRAPRLTMVPLLDHVTAGRLKDPLSQVPMEDVPLLAFADLGPGDFFGLQVDGDSMDRYSPEGSVIIINKRDRELISGRCYVFALNGATTYKVWRDGDHPHLAPWSTNPSNSPIFFKKRDMEVIGRVKRTILDL